jgi:ribonuclease D
MRESLARLLRDVVGIFIDKIGSLKDWYQDALDDLFGMLA